MKNEVQKYQTIILIMFALIIILIVQNLLLLKGEKEVVEALNKIDTILYLCNEENSEISIDNIVLNDIDTIYLGDDFVLFVTNKNSILKYVLPYDERANDEIKLIIESLG